MAETVHPEKPETWPVLERNRKVFDVVQKPFPGILGAGAEEDVASTWSRRELFRCQEVRAVVVVRGRIRKSSFGVVKGTQSARILTKSREVAQPIKLFPYKVAGGQKVLIFIPAISVVVKEGAAHLQPVHVFSCQDRHEVWISVIVYFVVTLQIDEMIFQILIRFGHRTSQVLLRNCIYSNQ